MCKILCNLFLGTVIYREQRKVLYKISCKQYNLMYFKFVFVCAPLDPSVAQLLF